MARCTSLAFAVIAGALLVFSGVVRAQDSGNLLALEARLAPYLAAGGTLADLCEEGEVYCPGCLECDRCCLHVSATLPADNPVAHTPWRLVATQAAVSARRDRYPTGRRPLPPARAPPSRV